MKKLARLGCVALLLTVAPSCKNLPMMGEAQAQASLIPLTIKTSTAVRKFRVEVARTEDEQARGLMFRQSLAEDGGMIFPMSPPRFASFWMKNTVIPLDMIFIRGDGTIARIASDTIPYSLEPVDSGEPVAAVLELAGGKAAALGIAEDDVVTWEDK
jgi:uncharacterized membrane protein (UPF0127 family)